MKKNIILSNIALMFISNLVFVTREVYFKIKIILVFCLICVFCFNLNFPYTEAANLSSLNDTLSQTNINAKADHQIIFTTPSGVVAGQNITIIFPSDFDTSGVDYTDIDLLDDGVDIALNLVPAGATWGAVFGGVQNRVLTFTSGTGAIAGGSIMTIKIGTNASGGNANNQIKNPSALGSYTISISAGNGTDTGDIGIFILTQDKIGVMGEIESTISMIIENTGFDIGNISIGFGIFTNTNVRYATADKLGSFTEPENSLPTQIRTSTNVERGLTVYIYDEGDGKNAGLYSPETNELLGAVASSSVVSDKKNYGIYGKNVSELTLDEGFDNDSYLDKAISRNMQIFASTNKMVNNGAVDISFKAARDGATKAGLYQDIITIICTSKY